MEPTQPSRPPCRGPWRALCILTLAAGITGLAWLALHFVGGGREGHADADGAETLALLLGPTWAALGTRNTRCKCFVRKAKQNTDGRPWHER